MMKIFTTLLAVLITVSLYSQDADFIADGDWATGANWSTGIVPTGLANLLANPAVTGNQTITKLKSSGASDRTISGTGILSMTGNGNPVILSSGDAAFIIDCNLELNTSAVKNTDTRFFPNNKLVFGPNSTLTLNQTFKIRNYSVNPVEFNGTIIGGSNITVNTTNTNTGTGAIQFGATANNPAWGGKITSFTEDIISNVVAPNIFLSDSANVTFNNSGGSLTINGANTFEGSVVRTGGAQTTPATINFNANQNNMNQIRLWANILDVNIDPSVTELFFKPFTNQTWNGTLNINGFKNGVIRIGTTDTTITAAQLAMINIGGGTVAINKNGYLYNPATATAPTVATPIADMTENVGFSTKIIVLSNYFADADMDSLAFTAISSDMSVATVSISNDTLTITEVGTGTTTITVTADDIITGTVSDAFDFTISSGNAAPTVTNPIMDMVLNQNFTDSTFSIAAVFSDGNGDALTYTATSSSTGVATVSISTDMLTITEVDTGMTTITVTADDGNGGTVSDDFTVHIQGNTATFGVNPIEGLKVFPSPTTGQLTISYNEAIQNGTVKIFNTTGVLLQAHNISNETTLNLNISENATGLYLIVIEDNTTGKTSTVKVLKK